MRDVNDAVAGRQQEPKRAADDPRSFARSALRAVACLREIPGRVADIPRARRWRSALEAELARPRTPELLRGTPDEDGQLVVMCLWRRPELLDDILRLVDSQQRVAPLRLVLWNNNPETSRWNRERIGAYEARGTLQSIEYVDSPTNLMGMARFVAMRNAVLAGHQGATAITLDDDVAFFTEIPLRFRMIEDLWASSRALERGWKLTKVAADVEFVLRERDQGHRIRNLKSDFYEHLRG